jgi:DNA topoisomerase-1
MDAPTEDDKGNKTLVRFSRKTREQYVQSEVNKKATGWKAFYRNGEWEVSKTLKKSRKKTASRGH